MLDYQRPSARIRTRRDALVPDAKTKAEMRTAIENAAYSATSTVRTKKRAQSTRPTSRRMRERMRLERQPVWPSEASQPCSPTHQILKIKAQRKQREMHLEVSKDDWERYER